MSERTKLLKKAVLAGVGASTNVDRVKSALNDAMQDLVKVGQDLLDELESKGKVKTDSVQMFLRNLQTEATKKTSEIEKKISNQVQMSVKKAVKELGLVSREEWEEMHERVTALEDAFDESGDTAQETKKSRGRQKKYSTH